MHQEIEKLCANLIKTSHQASGGLSKNEKLRGGKKLTEIYGVTYAPMNCQELGLIGSKLATAIRSTDSEVLSYSLESTIPEFQKNLSSLQEKIMQPTYMQEKEGVHEYFSILETIRFNFLPHRDWQSILYPDFTASNVTGKLSQLSQTVRTLSVEIKEIQEELKGFQLIHKDSHSLMEGITQVFNEAKQTGKNINDALNDARAQSIMFLEQMETYKRQAETAIKKCGEAYSAATTEGLAKYFDERAKGLKYSVYRWIGCLIFSLSIAVCLGSQKIDFLSSVLHNSNPQWSAVLINLIVYISSLGAPVWFAWLCSKQIGHNFRLMEDYAFKAVTAKSYEGYRIQSLETNPELGVRLFESALARLDEAPLRLIESSTPGSPWHEFFNKLTNKFNKNSSENELRELLEKITDKKPNKDIEKLIEALQNLINKSPDKSKD